MDSFSNFILRLKPALPLLAVWFAVGLVIAAWDPHPKLILTVALGISSGMLVLGPYAAAALYSTHRQGLRWLLCLSLALSAVLLLHYLFHWSALQLILVSATAVIGTILGHDATLAVLELRETPHLDWWMVVLFPILLGLAALAGYSSLGFGLGSFRFLAALWSPR